MAIPLLVSARGDAGRRAPVSLPGHKSPVGNNSRVPLPGLLAPPGCLHSHPTLHRGLFTPAPALPPRMSTPAPQCTALHDGHASLFTLSSPFSFSVIISLVLSPPLNQRGRENLSSKGILKESKENDPRRPPHPRRHQDAHLRAERRATPVALLGQEILQNRRESTVPRPPHLLPLRDNLSFALSHLRFMV